MGGGRKDMDGGRKSVNGGYDPSGRKSRIPAAYPVTMLVDLQVYVVPREKWVLSRRLYRHNIVEEGISLGFVRVLPQLSIHNLRRELQLQLGPDVIPRDFIFVRAVGNIFIQLKPKQEIELKVKNFIPPFSAEPEIYLLEVLPNEDPRMISPLPLLLREDTPPHICHDLCHHSLARKIVRRDREPDSPQPTTPFPPVSITPSPTPYNPMTPISPSEYKTLLEQYQEDEAGQITKSQSDLAARQVAYDYENEVFETPTPSPIKKKSALPRPLVRQKSVHPATSVDNEDLTGNSRTQTDTTESPSSADTVRTAIHRHDETRSTSRSETQTITSIHQDQEVSNTSTNERKELAKHLNGAFQETENETESKFNYSTSNHEITTDDHNKNEQKQQISTDEEENLEAKKSTKLEPENQKEESEHKIHTPLDEVTNLKTEEVAETIPLPEIINKPRDLSVDKEDADVKLDKNTSSGVSSTQTKSNEVVDHEVIDSTIVNPDQQFTDISACTQAISVLSTSKVAELQTSDVAENLGVINPADSTETTISGRINTENTQEHPTSPEVNEKHRISPTSQDVMIRKNSQDHTTSPKLKGKHRISPVTSQDIMIPENDPELKGKHRVSPETDQDTQQNDNILQSNYTECSNAGENNSQQSETNNTLSSKHHESFDDHKQTAKTSENNHTMKSHSYESSEGGEQTYLKSENKHDVKSHSHSHESSKGPEKTFKTSEDNNTTKSHSKESSKGGEQTFKTSESNRIVKSHSYESSAGGDQTSTTSGNKHTVKSHSYESSKSPEKPIKKSEDNHTTRSHSKETSDGGEKTSTTSEIEQTEAAASETISRTNSPPKMKNANTDETSSPKFKVPDIPQIKPPINPTGIEKVNKEKRKKAKEFRDPRKPAAYPQRMTKTTIARQALAREKRRVYVEERIQSYMRSSQQTATQQSSKSFYSQTRTRDDHEGHRETKSLEKDEEKVEKASSSAHLHHGGSTNTRESNMNPLQSLPDINAYSYNINPNMYSPYYDPSPKTLSAVSVLKPLPYSYSSPFAMAEANAHRSHSDMTSQETYDAGSRSSGIYVDSNPEATSNYWKNVSEQGFFYSFRVRQSGTVQMIDKGIQTGEQPQSYILDFSRKSDGTYYQKSSKPLPQTSSTTHLPPINRDKILRDISETVQLRHDAELRRAELIQRANDLQALVKEKREKINRRHEFWHKKYIEESSMTRPMEAACNSLRSELNTVHRRLIAHLEGRDLPLRLRDGPSKKANYKIMAARLQHEIKELQQKAKSAKLRLESEIKLKEQAEREVRDIRNDLAHKKVVMSLARSQIGGTLPSAHPRAYDSLVY